MTDSIWNVRFGGHRQRLVYIFLHAHILEPGQKLAIDKIVHGTEMSVYYVRQTLEYLEQRGAVVINRGTRPWSFTVIAPEDMKVYEYASEL